MKTFYDTRKPNLYEKLKMAWFEAWKLYQDYYKRILDKHKQ